MILAWVIIILMAAGIACWLLHRRNQAIGKWIALAAASINRVLACMIWSQNQSGLDRGEWLIQLKQDWIPSFGISFHLAVDGLGAVMLMLTFFLGILSVLCSWKELEKRAGFYFFNLLWTLAG